MRYNFYLAHHATTPGRLDAQLVILLTKLFALGQKVVVRCPDKGRMQRLSDLLWKTPRTGFVPHATANDDASPEKQPIFITDGGANPSGGQVLLRLHGSGEDPTGFDEVIEFFGGLEAEKDAARQRWKMAQEQNIPRRFFAYEDGKWHLKSEQA